MLKALKWLLFYFLWAHVIFHKEKKTKTKNQSCELGGAVFSSLLQISHFSILLLNIETEGVSA